LITKLEDNEEELNKELLPFIRAMFKKFYENRGLFTNTVSCVGELDCLCALAVVSGKQKMCKPKIHAPGKGLPKLSIKKIRHPCLQSFLSKGDFIPNDV
jgi:DNA mismatch repair ATPase MutS